MKRTENTTGIKISHLSVTNNRGSRYKITQLNSGKSVVIDAHLPSEPTQYFCSILENIEIVNSFNLIIDNTQKNYFLFNVDFNGNGFENILTYFKK